MADTLVASNGIISLRMAGKVNTHLQVYQFMCHITLIKRIVGIVCMLKYVYRFAII